jgi:hypothetical protein
LRHSNIGERPPGWFDRFALSPAVVPFDSNKDELWLHLSLLESRRDGCAVARRRLLPARLPARVGAVYVRDAEMNWRRRMIERLRWAAYLASRVVHHAAALPSVARSGARGWWGRGRGSKQPGRPMTPRPIRGGVGWG